MLLLRSLVVLSLYQQVQSVYHITQLCPFFLLLQAKTVTFCETGLIQILTFELSYIYLSLIIWENKLVFLRVSKVF